MENVRIEVNRIESEYIQRASRFSAATLLEAAGKKGALPSAIKPLSPSMKVCGSVITVSSPPADNIMLHQAIAIARPGDILAVEVSGWHESGYWGDIMTHAALERQIGGLIIDGCIRDGHEIVEMGFPVFSRGLCIRGTGKNGGGRINHTIKIGDVIIEAGDLVVGDGDGVVVIPKTAVPQVLQAAQKREEDEESIRQALKSGKTTMEIYGWKFS